MPEGMSLPAQDPPARTDATHAGLRIGLTGGIGSGKSTVAALWVQRGAHLIDTDAISRTLTAPGGPALGPLRQAFGEDLFTPSDELDRGRLRDLVFADPQAKSLLESILHPMIGAECRRQAAAAPVGALLVFDVPLLVESPHWRTQVDRVLVVDCNEATQAARVIRRSGWTAPTVQRVIAQQATRAQRRACADAIVFNDGLTLEQLAAEVQALWSRWSTVEQSTAAR